MKRALAAALALAGCATYDKQIAAHRAAYDADTVLQQRMVEPLAIEPSHGQVTVVVTRKFAEKILQASLKPNVMTVIVAKPGVAWRSEGRRLGVGYVNQVALMSGSLRLDLKAGELALDQDTVALHTHVDGSGAVHAQLHFFGVTAERDVVLVMTHDQQLALKLEADGQGWRLRAVGPPLHAQVNVQMPALTLAGQDLYDVKIERGVELPLEQLKPWPVPLPAPRAVDVGPEKVRVGLQHAQFGAHGGVLWLGADVLVEDGDQSK